MHNNTHNTERSRQIDLVTYRIIDEQISLSVVREKGRVPAYILVSDFSEFLEKTDVRSCVLIMDFKKLIKKGRIARQWFKSEGAAKSLLGCALIAEDSVQSLLADAWMKTTSFPFPLAKHRDYRAAIEWTSSLASA